MTLHRTDVDRWSSPLNLKPSWSSRAQVVAALLADCSAVLDLGCGRMDLEGLLAPGVRYLPCDLVARDPRTLVCDLNRGELPPVDADVVSLLGVLEYVYDPAALMAGIAVRWRRMVLTYNPADLACGRDRRSHGWVNDLTSAQLVSQAAASGFDLQAIVPFGDRQRIYDFARPGRLP
jgi:hypothetical protein